MRWAWELVTWVSLIFSLWENIPERKCNNGTREPTESMFKIKCSYLRPVKIYKKQLYFYILTMNYMKKNFLKKSHLP